MYQIEAHEMPFQTRKKPFRFDRYVCLGNTLNLDTCSKFWGNFEGIWANPGEILHIGWKILGVYRVNVVIYCQLYLLLSSWGQSGDTKTLHV